MAERLLMMKEEMKEDVKKRENPVRWVSRDVKQINDKVEILESKAEVINKKMERKLDNLSVEIERRNFVWGFWRGY